MQIKSYKRNDSLLEKEDEKKATKTDHFFEWLRENHCKNNNLCQEIILRFIL